MFSHVGEIVYAIDAGSADTVLEAAIDAGADDVESDAKRHVITCGFAAIGDVTAALTEALGDPNSVSIHWKPNTLTPVDEEKAATLLKLIATLDDDDDVQHVFANFEVSDEVMAKLTVA